MAVNQQQQAKDPNWVCTFEMVKNQEKKADKHPDLIHPASKDKDTGQVKLNKAGKPFKKNFTINGIWMEASGYFQKDKSLKITIKKTSTDKKADDDGFADQF